MHWDVFFTASLMRIIWIHHIIFRLYLYFLNNVLYFFKCSCTNILHRRSLYTFYISTMGFLIQVKLRLVIHRLDVLGRIISLKCCRISFGPKSYVEGILPKGPFWQDTLLVLEATGWVICPISFEIGVWGSDTILLRAKPLHDWVNQMDNLHIISSFWSLIANGSNVGLVKTHCSMLAY